MTLENLPAKAPLGTEESPGNAARGVEQLWQDASLPNDGDKESAMQAWKQTIDVQMHFNDICMRIRSLAITMLTAVVSFSAYTVKERMTLDLGAIDVPIGSVVAAGGLAGWLAFWAMDRHWYHVFLRAAGIHAGRVERRWCKALPELLLSSQISESSRRTLLGWPFDSGRRLTAFYALGAIVLITTGILVWKARVPLPQKPAGPPTAIATPTSRAIARIAFHDLASASRPAAAGTSASRFAAFDPFTTRRSAA